MAVRTLLVDGYNFIGWRSGLRAARLEADRDRLVAVLARYVAVRGHRVTVVFDGAGRGGAASERTRRGVREVYSPPGLKADPWIVAEVRRLNGECAVVTDDRALAMHCDRAGGVVLGCEAFSRVLEAAEAPAAPPADDAGRGPAAAPEPARLPDRDDDLLARMMEVPDDMAARKALDDPGPARGPDGATRAQRRRRNLLADL